MKNFLKRLFDILFPILRFISANRKINKRIAAIDNKQYENNFLYIGDYQKYSYEEILPFYQKTIEIKKTLEDKAKISAVGITISTSIIVGLSGLLLNLNIDVKQLNAINILLIILCVIVIVHINISGILALFVIGNKNKIYQLFPEDSKLSKKKQANCLSIFTEQNTNLNIIRQNYVYSSFLHLIYSVLMLSLIFVLATFNFNGGRNKSVDLLKLSDELAFCVKNNKKQFMDAAHDIKRLQSNIKLNKSNYESIEKEISILKTKLLKTYELINVLDKKAKLKRLSRRGKSKGKEPE